jgi:hypothetical protein
MTGVEKLIWIAKKVLIYIPVVPRTEDKIFDREIFRFFSNLTEHDHWLSQLLCAIITKFPDFLPIVIESLEDDQHTKSSLSSWGAPDGHLFCDLMKFLNLGRPFITI